jgi:DNA topoisomerase IB
LVPSSSASSALSAGFRYLAEASAIKDPETPARIKALVILPAWEDVWICPDPGGHIQAVGTDSAGRRQYRHHDQEYAAENGTYGLATIRKEHVTCSRTEVVFDYLAKGADLGKGRDFGELATRGDGEKAVLKLRADQS